MAVHDQHLEFVPVAAAIAALIGAGVLLAVAGLALRWCLRARGRVRRTARSLSVSPRAASGVPASAVRAARLGAIGGVGEVLDRSRRLVAAEARVARELAAAGGWLV